MPKINFNTVKTYLTENYLLSIYLISLIIGAFVHIPKTSFMMTMCGGHSGNIITQSFLFFSVILIIPFISLIFSKTWILLYDFIDTYSYWIIFLGIYSLTNKISGEKLDDFLDFTWQVTIIALCMRIAIKRNTININNKLIWLIPFTIFIASLYDVTHYIYTSFMLIPFISWAITRRYSGFKVLWWQLAIGGVYLGFTYPDLNSYTIMIAVLGLLHATILNIFNNRKNK